VSHKNDKIFQNPPSGHVQNLPVLPKKVIFLPAFDQIGLISSSLFLRIK